MKMPSHAAVTRTRARPSRGCGRGRHAGAGGWLRKARQARPHGPGQARPGPARHDRRPGRAAGRTLRREPPDADGDMPGMPESSVEPFRHGGYREGSCTHPGSGAYLWVITETPTSAACPICPYKRTKIELMRKIPRPIARRIFRVIENRRGSGHRTAASMRSRGAGETGEAGVFTHGPADSNSAGACRLGAPWETLVNSG